MYSRNCKYPKCPFSRAQGCINATTSYKTGNALGKSNSSGFAFLHKKFPKISEAKLKKGTFVGPQIREVLKDPNFEKTMTALEQRAWKAFEWLCVNFLSCIMSPLFQGGVDAYFKLTKRYVFSANLGLVSDEQGERFYQDIQAMEACYQGFWNEGMMGDYCWMLYRDDQSRSYKRNSYSKHF